MLPSLNEIETSIVFNLEREKQKAQALERKEKEKKRTQKGERRARSSVLAVTMPVYVRDIRVCEDAVTMEYDETDMVK
ncbi:unnamed protein product, partial [Cyprideis torosa]